MERKVISKPPGLTLNGNNWFHEGWLFGTLGLPMRDWDRITRDVLVRDIDIESWELGYSTAIESGNFSISVIHAVIAQGQVVVGVNEF